MAEKNWVPQALLAFVEFCKKWKAVLTNSEYHPINVPGTVPELSPSSPPVPLSLTAS